MEGAAGGGGSGGEKPPPETRDALRMILDAGGLEMPPQPPPEFFSDTEGNLPADVVPIAGDSSGPEDAPAAPPEGVVPIAGDGAAAPPPSAPIQLDVGKGQPNPFYPDDDDDDDDEEPGGGNTWWKIVLGVLAAVVAVALGVYFLTSGSSKTPVSAPAPAAPKSTSKPAAPKPACPPPLKLEQLTIGDMDHECAGPAQYKSQPRSPYYSYFAWETTYAGRQVQLVVTGGPLKGAVHTATVSPSVSAVSSSAGKLADVDLYDNASGKKNFATTGSLTLDPRGAVRFHHVEVMFEGKKTLIQGLMTP